MNQEPAYYAVIPATVRYDNTLPPAAKLLYGEITALCNTKGFCWAGNSYFAKLYGVTKDTVSLWINKLDKRGYIRVDVKPEEGNIRHIYIVESPPPPIVENRDTPYREKKGEVPEKIAIPPIAKNDDTYREKSRHNNTSNTTREKNNLINKNANAKKKGEENSFENEGQKTPQNPPSPPSSPHVSFDDWYTLYGKPIEEVEAETRSHWDGLSADEKQIVYRFTIDYVAQTTNVRFRKHPHRFLRDKTWKTTKLYEQSTNNSAGQTTVHGQPANYQRPVAPAHRSTEDRADQLNRLFNQVDQYVSDEQSGRL